MSEPRRFKSERTRSAGITARNEAFEKAKDGDSWRHSRITLKPANPDFKPIVLTDAGDGELQVIAEVVDVLVR